MHNFKKVRKMWGGASIGDALNYYGLTGNSNMLGTDSAVPSQTAPISIGGITGYVPQKPEKTFKEKMADFANKFSDKDKVAIANAIGNAALMGTQAVNNDMYFTESGETAHKIGNMLGEIPILGNAFKLGLFGVSSIVKGLSSELGNFDYDRTVAERMGGSYNFNNITRAAEISGKSAFGKGLKEGRNIMNTAELQMLMLAGIDLDNLNRQAVAANVLQNSMNYNNVLNGGLDARYLRAAKLGIKLININRLKSFKTPQIVNINTKQVEEFKQGGTIELFIPIITEPVDLFKDEWIPIITEPVELFKDGGKTEEKYPKEYLQFKASLPDNQKNTPESEYDTYLGWQLYGKPKDFETAKELGMYTWDNSDNSWHGNTVAWDETTGIGHFLKPKYHSTIGYELDWFNKGIVTEEGGKQREMTPEERKDWEEFKVNYNLIDDGNFYKYVPKNKQGGQIKESEELVKLEETNLKNVIPEGALHKNKHHIENTEGLTLKGIPVIDNDGEQQAEIELDEIIFTLEVTKKLEELHKIYKEGSNKERDEAATEAGKLLVQEILYNTDDRTGLIAKCEKGGKL